MWPVNLWVTGVAECIAVADILVRNSFKIIFHNIPLLTSHLLIIKNVMKNSKHAQIVANFKSQLLLL